MLSIQDSLHCPSLTAPCHIRSVSDGTLALGVSRSCGVRALGQSFSNTIDNWQRTLSMGPPKVERRREEEEEEGLAYVVTPP